MPGRRHERFASDLAIRLAQGEGFLRNVSASGVYFLTEAPLKPGDALEFNIDFPGVETGPVSARCKARVVRVETQGAHTGVGAAFEAIELLGLSRAQ